MLIARWKSMFKSVQLKLSKIGVLEMID